MGVVGAGVAGLRPRRPMLPLREPSLLPPSAWPDKREAVSLDAVPKRHSMRKPRLLEQEASGTS